MSIELRELAGGALVLEGIASRTEIWYPIGRSQEECVKRGAFRRTLSENPDVCLRVEHSALPLARTTSLNGGRPTLELYESREGLVCNAELNPRDRDVQDLRAKAEHTPLEMSFAFKCNRDAWDEHMEKREVFDVGLHKGDVSVVAYGANDQTGFTMSERVASTLEERRAIADLLKGRFTGPSYVELRSDFTQSQLEAMGAKGEAFKNPDGHWSYPTPNRDYFAKAVRAVGRGSASHDAIRKYLIDRAKKMGWTDLLPSNWSARAAASVCARCEGTGKIENPNQWGGWITCPNCGGTDENVEPDGEEGVKINPQSDGQENSFVSSERLWLEATRNAAARKTWLHEARMKSARGS